MRGVFADQRKNVFFPFESCSMASEVCKHCRDDLAEIDEDLVAYIAGSMESAPLFNKCGLCGTRSINVLQDTIRRAKFLAISAAIIIAYGTWNSFMYSRAMQTQEDIPLPDVVERIGSVDKDIK